MSEPQRRATRRNMSTQPIQGRPTRGQNINHSPITDEELADIIAQARAQRAEEDIREYAERKAS